MVHQGGKTMRIAPSHSGASPTTHSAQTSNDRRRFDLQSKNSNQPQCNTHSCAPIGSTKYACVRPVASDTAEPNTIAHSATSRPETLQAAGPGPIPEVVNLNYYRYTKTYRKDSKMSIKTTRLLTILIALAALATITAEASAYLHPGTGRFISRDPGPGSTTNNPAQGAHFPPRDPSPNDSSRSVTTVPAPTTGFIPRDPTGTNQYADGMNLYQYVRSNPVGLTDFLGLNTERIHWEKVSGAKDQYRATKDGASLEQLADHLIMSKSSWRCLWPVKRVGKNTKKSRDLYHKKKSAVCDDIYDVSNLTATTGPSLIGAFARKGKRGKRHLIEWYRPDIKIFETGAAIGYQLKTMSGAGKTPIDSVVLFSHGSFKYNSLNDGDMDNLFTLHHMIEDRRTVGYELSEKKKGPRICWFRPGATVRFVGCYTRQPAEWWAKHMMRGQTRSKGTGIRGRVYGTTKWLQIIKGEGARLLGKKDTGLANKNPKHPKITTPFVGYDQLLTQDGWEEYIAEH
jgi:hypothetical protein